MPTIIAGLICVAAVAGMVACAVWYRRARSRQTLGRINAVQFNVHPRPADEAGMGGKGINP